MADPSTDLATTSSNLPAALGDYKIATVTAERLKSLIESNVSGGISPFDLDRIKVPAGGGVQWAVPTLDGVQHQKEVEGVIVAWSDQRAYWKQEFSGAGTPPDCSSKDSITGQGEPGGACQRCAFAQFKSAMKNGQAQAGQACKQVRLIFLLRASDMLPVVLVAPPTSLGNLKNYFLTKLAGNGMRYFEAVTRFTLSEDKNASGIKYSKIEPRFVRQVSDAEAAKIEAYSKSIQGVLSTIDAAADIGEQS